MFRIGEFARLAGVSARVLRNYDDAGLFSPAWVDPDSGYRFYLASQLPDLRQILALKDLGVPLARIQELQQGGTALSTVLAEERERLERQHLETERRLAAMDITLADVHAGEPAVVVRRIESQLVATLRGSHVEALFYELEKAVQRHGVRVSRPPMSIQHADGPEVAVPVRGSVTEGEVTSRRLPPTRAATLLHRGPYETFGETRARFDRWIDGAGYQRTGPLRIVYLRFGAESDLDLDPRYLTTTAVDLLTELVQPVA